MIRGKVVISGIPRRFFASAGAALARPAVLDGTFGPRAQVAVFQTQSRNMSGGSGTPLGAIRTDWTHEEISEIYNRPLVELMFDAATVHRMYHNPREVQQATLLSIKTGGCPETCSYCSQSSKWSKETKLPAEKLLELDDVGPKQFERVLDMVSKIRALGMEVCTTLGMLTTEQAQKLKHAGLSCYNHNVDTSAEFYPKITSSRTYDDRLDTIGKVREAGIGVCSGGIIGLGEKTKDRVGLLHTLATLPEHPESVPINALVAVEGTPLHKMGVKGPSGLEMARCVATARIVMPKSNVRLSAGRMEMSFAEQGMCFMAGANSIFAGDKLLTTPNAERDDDAEMFEALGLVNKPAFNGKPAPFEIPAERMESIQKREEKASLRVETVASASA